MAAEHLTTETGVYGYNRTVDSMHKFQFEKAIKIHLNEVFIWKIHLIESFHWTRCGLPANSMLASYEKNNH